MLIQQIRSAQIADAVVNFAITPFVIVATLPLWAALVVFINGIYDWHSGNWDGGNPILLTLAGGLCSLPALFFVFLGLANIYRIAAPSSILIDRERAELVKNRRYIYPIIDITALNIAYTGFRSPSRYTLKAVLVSGKSITMESSGYFGSRQELVDLSHLIADFTKRLDLHAR